MNSNNSNGHNGNNRNNNKGNNSNALSALGNSGNSNNNSNSNSGNNSNSNSGNSNSNSGNSNGNSNNSNNNSNKPRSSRVSRVSKTSRASRSSKSSKSGKTKSGNRYYRLVEPLIVYKRVGKSGHEEQKNPYGHFKGAEPLKAAYKAFKEIATSMEIERHIGGNSKYKLDKAIAFTLMETTGGKNKTKRFEGRRAHKTERKVIRLKNGKEKTIEKHYKDSVHTLKPSRNISPNALNTNGSRNTGRASVGSSRVQ